MVPSGPGPEGTFAIRATNNQIPWRNLSLCQSVCVGKAEGVLGGEGGNGTETSNLEKEGGEFPRQGSMEEGTSDGDM